MQKHKPLLPPAFGWQCGSLFYYQKVWNVWKTENQSPRLFLVLLECFTHWLTDDIKNLSLNIILMCQIQCKSNLCVLEKMNRVCQLMIINGLLWSRCCSADLLSVCLKFYWMRPVSLISVKFVTLVTEFGKDRTTIVVSCTNTEYNLNRRKFTCQSCAEVIFMSQAIFVLQIRCSTRLKFVLKIVCVTVELRRRTGSYANDNFPYL